LTLCAKRAKVREYIPAQVNARINYQLDITNRNYSRTDNIIPQIEQVVDEPVFCVSVPSSFVIVRRKGRVCVTGNSQQIPPKIRSIFTPEEGHCFVFADFDQLELRMASALAGATNYLEVFDRIYKKYKSGAKIDKFDPHEDPHSLAASMIFPEWASASTTDKERIRYFAKRFQFACLYRAEIPTVHRLVISVEDDEGNLINAHITEAETALKRERWLKNNPEFEKWWDTDVESFRQQGYLREPVLGRQRDFLDGLENSMNEIANFRTQSGGAAVAASAWINLVENGLSWYCYGHNTGIFVQVHDALGAEVPENKGKEVQRMMEECMETRVPGLPVVFTVESKITHAWFEPKGKKKS